MRLIRAGDVPPAAAMSVLISAFVALTFSSISASHFLKTEEGEKNRVFRAMGRILDTVTSACRRVLTWSLDQRDLIVEVAVSSLAVTAFLMGRMEEEFVPPEDREKFIISVEAPLRSTLECADTRIRQIDRVPGLAGPVRSDESAAGAS